MNMNKLYFSVEEKKIAELSALCAENIKMMILDKTKIPNSNLSPAIRDMCDDIYYWQRDEYDDMRFNIVYSAADKRFHFPDHLYMVDVSTVMIVTGHRILEGYYSTNPLIRLGNIIVDGLLGEYEVRNRVPKNVYWEELYESNDLLLDLIPSGVTDKLFERDESYSDISEHQYPQIGYLRLVHNAMAWITLYDRMRAEDLIFTTMGDDLLSSMEVFRNQLDSLLGELWEPIDSLREYIHYHCHILTDSGKRKLVANW